MLFSSYTPNILIKPTNRANSIVCYSDWVQVMTLFIGMALFSLFSLVSQEPFLEESEDSFVQDSLEEELIEENIVEGTQTTLWYRSNQLGMALELLENPRDMASQEWGLELESGPQQRLKTLYYWGKRRDTWLLIYRNGKPFQEQHKRYGKLLENRLFDEVSATLSEISRYSAVTGVLEKRELFFYNQRGDLIRSMLYDEDNQLTRENIYRLDSKGRLIKLKVQRYDRKYDLVQYQLEGVDTFIKTGGDQDKYQVNLFDEQRRNTSQILYLDNVVAKRSRFEYTVDGTLKRSVVTEPQQLTTQYDYNDSGLLIQKQVWQKGILTEKENYSYNGSRRLLSKKKTIGRNSTEERFSYQGASPDLEKIEFYRDGEIEKIRFYSGLYTYYEELYLDGESVAKIYYDYNDQLYTEVTVENIPSPEIFDEALLPSSSARE